MSDHATSIPLHVRSIRMEARRAGAEQLEVTGRLVDERPAGSRWFGIDQGTIVHEMAVTLRVRYPGLVITHVSATMDTRPYTVCTDAIDPLQQLVGLSVTHGLTRAVNERFGRHRGCAHLTALIQAMAPVIRQAAGAASRDERELPRPEDRWFVNTCQAWREGGELYRRLVAGDVAGLRALSARQRGGQEGGGGRSGPEE